MLAIGMILHGYCNGYFGRDSFFNKRVEAFGADWIVARTKESGVPLFAEFANREQMLLCIKEWAEANA